MPTNEERRETAARLRNAEIENIGLTYSAHLGEAIGECVRLVSGHEGIVKGGLNRLADLIEPDERICEVAYDESGCPCCGKCGCALYNTSGYCPNCGCRIKEEPDADN